MAVGLAVAVALAFGSYLLQVVSPLRIEFDSTEYLVLAAWIADGHGIPSGSSFPPGLPALIAGLDAVGAARSWGIVVMNSAFIGVGVGALMQILRRDLGYRIEGALAVVLACLLAVPMIQYASHPMTEAPFFGMSLVTLALASAAYRGRRIGLLVAASVAVVAAISIRTFGVALVPALLPPLLALAGTRTRKLVLLALGTAIASLAVIILSPVRYVEDATRTWGHDPLGTAADHGRNLLAAVAELAVNVPLDRAPDFARWVYPFVGAALTVAVVVGALAIRRRAPVVTVYLASSTALLIAWPLDTPRLLLPIFPLLVVSVAAAAAPYGDRAQLAVRAWMVAFAVVGMVAFAAVTRDSFSGDRFPEVYGTSSKTMQATYRVAWGTAAEVDRTSLLPRTLWALRRYESRAIGDPGPLPPVSENVVPDGNLAGTRSPTLRPHS